ncbi:Zn-dependent hydrolase [Paenalkalicoccus suaedae]|uniref:Zn-dependent hydrolase n=1 Tax=Paenalkalicoccus suaedae TaxID=2592382 RepID=A0A859FG51_9BACI|nr:Zn-dependent hydrolase [Paenalkalicoccus suaedae]QKS72343.1 Zn-dependent hydrolase [Paenalkalicoccus suaedae]
MEQSIERVGRMLSAINKVGHTKNGQQRIAYTAEEDRVFEVVADWCKELSMTVRMDQAGNLIARRKGRQDDLPAIAIGSHLDTVYTGGGFDGTIGVIAGVEIIHRLNEAHVETEHPIEVIAFRAEESSRFGVATIGSKAMAGTFDTERLQHVKDRDGVTLKEALQQKGLHVETMNESKRTREELQAFFEMHIEQGPELEQAKKPVAIASAIAAPTRLSIDIMGKYAHSGTTAMDKRKDALVVASHLILAVESFAKTEASLGTIGTVGIVDVDNGAMNVVPGHVTLKVDIRGINVASIKRVVEAVYEKAEKLASDQKVAIEVEVISEEAPVPLSERLQHTLKQAAGSVGIAPITIPSGAGHDAMNLAAFTDSALLFIPSRDGVSHHPEEYSSMQDIVCGIDVLEEAVKQEAVAHTKELNSP